MGIENKFGVKGQAEYFRGLIEGNRLIVEVNDGVMVIFVGVRGEEGNGGFFRGYGEVIVSCPLFYGREEGLEGFSGF